MVLRDKTVESTVGPGWTFVSHTLLSDSDVVLPVPFFSPNERLVTCFGPRSLYTSPVSPLDPWTRPTPVDTKRPTESRRDGCLRTVDRWSVGATIPRDDTRATHP